MSRVRFSPSAPTISMYYGDPIAPERGRLEVIREVSVRLCSYKTTDQLHRPDSGADHRRSPKGTALSGAYHTRPPPNPSPTPPPRRLRPPQTPAGTLPP